jgi:hypothetical protein
MDVPLLPPLPLPEGHSAHNNACTNNNAVPFLVGQYFIEGVQDLPKELCSHVIVYYEELITLMEGASESWQLITKAKYTTILTALIHIRDGEPVKLLRSIYPQILSGAKNMPLLPAVTVLLSWHALTMPTVMPGLTKNVDVETVMRLTYFEAAYSEIWRAHGPEHAKGRRLSACLNKHVDNIG